MKLVTRNARRTQGVCSHHSTVSVTHAGLERIICDDCSEVRLVYKSEGIQGDPSRGSFSRDVDEVVGA